MLRKNFGLATAALFAFVLGAPLAPLHAAAPMDLNRDWQFRADPDEMGEWLKWDSAPPVETESVTIPHTWNVGRLHDYMGVGWYFRNFDRPVHNPNAHVQLHFGATFYKSQVWLNGVEIGRHEGGFTAYSFDITSQLRDHNYLAVRIDNRPGSETIPGYGMRGTPQSWYDWWTYGGIVRNVWLSTSGATWIERQQIRPVPEATAWSILDQVHVHSALPAGTAVTLRARVYDPEQRLATNSTQALNLGSGDQAIKVSLKLSQPRLWGIDHPDLYRLIVDLIGPDGQALDTHSDTFGLRKIEIRDRHLLVNGERMRLTGMDRHEDSPDEGLAETPATMRRDYDDMKALNTTLTRPVHYPQNPFILDYADRHGILLIPEIPVWQFSAAQLSDPKVLALAKQQMREMIEEAGNHPSIFAWSLGDESDWDTSSAVAYFREMRAMIRELDPDRFVSFADDNLPKLTGTEQSAANDADFLMMNEYFGTWEGSAEGLEAGLDHVNALFPSKMVIISEFGFPGRFAQKPADADPGRVLTYEQQLPVLAARDWIAGAIMWCYQDYKSRRNLFPGQVEGFVEHGVVDEWRRPKPSYAVWQRLTASARIDAKWTGNPATGFEATITPNSERQLPYYPLTNYRLVWTIQDDAGIALASGTWTLKAFRQPEQISGQLPAGRSTGGLRLEIKLLRPLGSVAAEGSLELPADVSMVPP
jgi:hypothetical protein